MRTIRPTRPIQISNSWIFRVGLVIFFWTLFDSTLTYAAPLVMSSYKLSDTMIGLIIGTSSIAGAAFDFILCMFFRKANFRRLFLFMLAISFVYPLVLGRVSEIWGFLFAMMMWGIYFDFYGFGVFNYVSQYVKPKQHASAFGKLQASRWMGNILAPLIASALVAISIAAVFFAAQAFILVAIIFFAFLLWTTRNEKPLRHPIERHRSVFREFGLWKRLGSTIWAPLLVTFFLFFLDAFFWTLVPLYALSLGLQIYGGLFLAAYCVPLFLSGLFVGNYSKGTTPLKNAYIFLLCGSVFLALFGFSKSNMLTIALVCVASFFFGVTLPGVNSAYSSIMAKNPTLEREIEALEDSTFNASYVVGPMMAGFLADAVGIPNTFSILGALGVMTALVLLIFSPPRLLPNRLNE